jgi:hypothetical protein
MSAQSVEALLARLYVDGVLRERFSVDAATVMREAGLDSREAAAFANIDRAGLELAAESYARKRSARKGARFPWLAKARRAARYLVSKTSR